MMLFEPPCEEVDAVFRVACGRLVPHVRHSCDDGNFEFWWSTPDVRRGPSPEERVERRIM